MTSDNPGHLFFCKGCSKHYLSRLDSINIVMAEEVREKDNAILLADAEVTCDDCKEIRQDDGCFVYEGEVIVLLNTDEILNSKLATKEKEGVKDNDNSK